MAHCNVAARTIFCRDNLEILQGINTNCIDLIYLDPPFNKKKVFTAPLGSSAAGASFKDIFTQEDVKEEWLQTIAEDHDHIWHLLNAVKRIEGGSSYNFCYLVYMAIRLIECHRILNATGSIYLHCDPTMSHYLKLLLDCIFGEKNFRNEIVWCYHGPGSPNMRQFNRKTDSIFWYSKGESWIFSADEVRVPFKDPQQSLRRAMSTDGTFSQEDIKKYRERGKIPENWWEIRIAARSKREYVGYPTQKPLALLERIIQASSHQGDMVLDPFCGCATTCVAAEKLKRQWIGIDTSHQAYQLVKVRIEKEVYTEGLVKGDEGYLPGIHYFTDPPERTDKGDRYVEEKYVYVISHPHFPQEYRVGITRNIKSRLNSYQTSDPERQFKIEYALSTPYYRETEAYIHTKYENKHEWVRGKLEDIVKDIAQFKVEGFLFNETEHN